MSTLPMQDSFRTHFQCQSRVAPTVISKPWDSDLFGAWQEHLAMMIANDSDRTPNKAYIHRMGEAFGKLPTRTHTLTPASLPSLLHALLTYRDSQ